jgi:hypothetical protein
MPRLQLSRRGPAARSSTCRVPRRPTGARWPHCSSPELSFSYKDREQVAANLPKM